LAVIWLALSVWMILQPAGAPGTRFGDKSRWVSALEDALARGEIDLAVHSAKDVPTELPEGLELVAFPPRADPHDALCGAPSLSDLVPGARVGTSSLRRAAAPALDVTEVTAPNGARWTDRVASNFLFIALRKRS